MNPVKRLLISGYRSYELGIFNDKDQKIKVIKQILKQRITTYAESGTEWIIVGGQLGVEIWAAEVVIELQATYPELHLALIFPFAEFGSQWQEAKKEKLMELKRQANFVDAVSHQVYNNPSQLRNHTTFLLKHTDGVLLVYDDEYPGKTKYLKNDIDKKTEKSQYSVELIDVYDLQSAVNELFF